MVSNENGPSPFISGISYNEVRDYFYEKSKISDVNRRELPIDSRLINSENEPIKPLDRIVIKNTKVKLRTVLVFKNRKDEITDYEYECNKYPLFLKAEIQNYLMGEDIILSEEIHDSSSICPFFEELKEKSENPFDFKT